MANHSWRNRTLSAALSLAAASSVISGAIPTTNIQPAAQPSSLAFSNRHQSAFATTSGGRSRGGSFGDDAPPAASPAPASPPPASSQPYSESSYSDANNYDNYSSSTTSSSDETVGLLILIICAVIVVVIFRFGTVSNAATASAPKPGSLAYSAANPPAVKPMAYRDTAPQAVKPLPRTASRRLSAEITNNIVTITQVQVAMSAQARHVQQGLTQIAEKTDMSDKEELTQSFRETILTLLRSPETWTHTSTYTTIVRSRQSAQGEFEALSLEERSKFDVESISNVNGKVEKQDIVRREQGLAAHIVVTLIVGTAHDYPLLAQAKSTDELKTSLKALGSMTSDYLMMYEVLWSPQDESDSLTDDELLLNYPNLFYIG